MSKRQGTLTNLCLGWQGLNLLNEEGVWLHHHHQWDTRGLLDTAHQARVVHHLRPLTQGWRSLTATIGTARDKGNNDIHLRSSTSKTTQISLCSNQLKLCPEQGIKHCIDEQCLVYK